MLKIANAVFDVYDDTNLSVVMELDASLITCKVAELDEVEKLSDDQFGVVLVNGTTKYRKYPLHNEDSVKLSTAYFNKVKNTLHPSIVSKVESKLAGSKEVALVDLAYETPATVTEYKTAEPVYGISINNINYFPLHTANNVKLAISKFGEHEDKLNFMQRFELARNIKKHAEKHSINIEPLSHINNYTNGEINYIALSKALELRKVSAARATPELDALYNETNPVKIATVLTAFDKVAGISEYNYVRNIPDPFASMYKYAEKKVKPKPVYEVSASKLAELFDDDFVSEYVKNPEVVYNILPTPVKEQIQKLGFVLKDNEKPGYSDTIKQFDNAGYKVLAYDSHASGVNYLLRDKDGKHHEYFEGDSDKVVPIGSRFSWHGHKDEHAYAKDRYHVDLKTHSGPPVVVHTSGTFTRDKTATCGIMPTNGIGAAIAQVQDENQRAEDQATSSTSKPPPPGNLNARLSTDTGY